MVYIIQLRIEDHRYFATSNDLIPYICIDKLQNDFIMRIVLANLALLFGAIGFIGYLFIILASAIGCCTGVTTSGFRIIVIVILAAAALICGFCMLNNCCKVSNKEE